jgi:hypothetical protein
VDQIRQRLRMRGLRSHVMYTHNGSRLHALPLLASRSQALRYTSPPPLYPFDIYSMISSLSMFMEIKIQNICGKIPIE